MRLCDGRSVVTRCTLPDAPESISAWLGAGRHRSCALGVYPHAAAYARRRHGDAERWSADGRDPHGVWQEGAAYARWAPSPHNVQPWLLRVVSPAHCELLYNPVRLLPKTDPTSAFTIMGLTMFAEYLSAAVAPRGYAVRAEYIARPLDYSATRPTLFANLELVPKGIHPVIDRSVILKRQTSRLPYNGQRVEEHSMKAVTAIATNMGHTFEWSSNEVDVEWMIELNRFTLFDDLDRVPERTELRRWIRTSREEAAQKKDGLWSECLRFPGWLLKAFFDDHQKWGSGWRASVLGKALVLGMNGTRTVAWWSGPFAEPAHWIQAGRVLGQSWLELATRGIQIIHLGRSSPIRRRTHVSSRNWGRLRPPIPCGWRWGWDEAMPPREAIGLTSVPFL